ncbi:MAG: carbonic anhydrase [Thermoleophilia bacterium]|nr:carbonic anhydrase [Thermoleophilia bacterium]
MSDHPAARPHETVGQIMARLTEGNLRFAQGLPRLADSSPGHRASLAWGQSPAAAVLACSDSRVGPELLFDQGLGELFVVRVAGNVVEDTVLGSLEYAVEHLGVRAIVIMGHSSCGAVTSACACDFDGLEGVTGVVLRAIEPSVAAARSACSDPEEIVDVSARLNMAAQAEALLESPVITGAVAAGDLSILQAWYDLGSGLVSWL